MFWPILRFEVAYHLKRAVTWLYFGVLFVFAFALMASDAVVVVGAAGEAERSVRTRAGDHRGQHDRRGLHDRHRRDVAPA